MLEFLSFTLVAYISFIIFKNRSEDQSSGTPIVYEDNRFNEALVAYHKMNKADKKKTLESLSQCDQNSFLMMYDSYKANLRSQKQFDKWLQN